MSDLAKAIVVVAILMWRAAVLGTCTYLVFWAQHSGWWFLLAILLCGVSLQ